MSSQQHQTTTVVLGGGGAVGVGWQVGLVCGLREAGIDLATADSVLGTSAGSLVGALLSVGRDVADALLSLDALSRSIDRESMAVGNGSFLGAMRDAALHPDRRAWLRGVGAAAREARTLPEQDYLALFDVIDGTGWPEGFACTAIDAETGDLVVWSRSSGVPLRGAVASSCAIPMLFPAVGLRARRYLDGGLLSHLNAAAAPRADVVVVVSCHPLRAPDGSPDSALSPSEAAASAELDELRGRASVIAIEPDFGELGAAPERMMDVSLTMDAVRVGRRQARREAVAISKVWGR